MTNLQRGSGTVRWITRARALALVGCGGTGNRDLWAPDRVELGVICRKNRKRVSLEVPLLVRREENMRNVLPLLHSVSGAAQDLSIGSIW
jgi:hypothetical protein